MRRFVTLAVLFLFTIPFGISISGCSRGGTKTVFCGGGDTGPIVGQVNTITLLPRIFGISLNQGQIGQVASPQATDCNGTAVTVSAYTYGVFDANGHQSNALLQIADVVPSGVNAGKLCAGNWNRNTGGGIPDFTTCNVTGQSGEVYVVASGGGANSNPLPIFIHPKVTSVTLGNPTTACAATDSAVEAGDQSSNCCQLSKQATVTAAPYDGTSCISQTQSRQLVGRAYDTNGNNITCQVGHLNFAAQTTSLVTIDENGVATAQQPGSTVISADLTQAGSSAGFFSTCAPVSIALNVPSTSGNVTSAVVNQNTPQPLTGNRERPERNHADRSHPQSRFDDSHYNPGRVYRNHYTGLPRRRLHHGTLPAAYLQSFSPECDRSLRQREARRLEPCYHHHAGHKQHPALGRKHPVPLHPSRGLHQSHARRSGTPSVCSQLHGHLQRRQLDLHGNPHGADDLQRDHQQPLP